MINKLLRFVVIGTGFWSTLQIPAWLEVKNVKLTALYNRTYEKAVSVAEKFKINKVYSDPEEMIIKERPDFIDIITEVPAHEQFVYLAAKYKINVICQKPMAPDYITCKNMVEACRKAGIRFIIHENYRLQPQFRVFKEVLSKNLIGKIRRVEFCYGNRGRAPFKNQPFIKTLNHYIITDFGSHLFDLTRYFFGDPLSIYCHGLKTYEELAGEDSIVVILRYKDMLCTCAVSENVNNQIFVDGYEGVLIMDKNNNIKVINKNGEMDFKVPVSPKYDWAAHVYSYLPPEAVHNIVECNRSIYDSLVNDYIHETEGFENLKTMKHVYSACESTEKNIVVPI